MTRAGRPVTLARHYLRSLVALYALLMAVAIAAALVFVMWPMAQRAADDLAGLMQLSAQTWVELPPETREAFDDELLQAHRLAVRPDMAPPSDTRLRHGFYVRFLEQALARRQGHEVFLVQDEGPDGRTWLWTSLRIGARDMGVGFDYTRLHTRPLFALAMMLGTAMVVLGGGAFWLARRIAGPVERLESAAAALAAGTDPHPLPETGPRELARLAGHFNEMVRRVHELLEARTTLLAGVSHDLRTPLARMRLALEMLRERPDPTLIDRAERDVEAMNALIGDMLTLARGLNREAPQTLALAAWLRERAARAAEAAGVPAGRIAVHCPAGQQIEVAAGALGRVLDNLLGNALRYGGDPVELRAGPVADADGTALRIEVADRGPGIPADQLDAVWRPFQRVEGSRSPATGGFGLGLAIVRQLAQAHGWRVGLDNRAGGGLQAWVELPQGGAGAARGDREGHEAQGGRGRQPR